MASTRRMAAMEALPSVWRAAFDALPDATLIVDRTGNIVYANPIAETMTGRTSEQLLGQSIELLLPADRRNLHRTERLAYQRRPTLRTMGRDLDIRLLRADGSLLEVDVALNPIAIDGRDLVIAAVRDITDLRRTQEDLRVSRENFERLIDGVAEYAILMVDPEGHIVSWNRGAERLEGYTSDEILGRPLSVLYPPEDVAAERPQRNLREALAKGRLDTEGWRVRKGGSRYWATTTIAPLYDERGHLSGYSKITRDATERRRADIRMRTALAMSEATLRDAPSGEILLILGQGIKDLVDAATVLVATPQEGDLHVAVALGRDAERLHRRRLPVAGTHLGEIISTAEPKAFEVTPGNWQQYLPVTPSELPLDGLAVPVGVRAEVLALIKILRGSAGKPFGAADVAVVHALAQQAAVVLDYARSRAGMRQLAVLEDRERIARELHDHVIQELFGIGINLQATRSVATGPKVSERLEEAVDQLDGLVRDLRNYVFGLRPSLLDGVRLDRAVVRVARDLEAQSGIEVSLDVDSKATIELGSRSGDVLAALNEIFANLRRHSGARHVRVTLRDEGPYVCLEVTDDGRGFSVDEAASAGGMGLRNLKERMASLQGTFDVHSKSGQGSRVRLRLPRTPGRAMRP